MGKDQKASFIKRLITNIYLRNILLMIVAFLFIIWGVLFCLKIYTRHNDTIEVPNLKGLQVQDAEAMIASSNLKYEVIDSIYQKEGTPGSILEQIPKEKSRVKEGRTIYLTIQAKNEPLVAIPDLEDASLRQAEALLSALGFSKVNVVSVPSEYQDLVFGVEYKGQTITAGQKVPKGSVLTIKVGDGSTGDLAEEHDLSIGEDN